jgi:hypothetical protein
MNYHKEFCIMRLAVIYVCCLALLVGCEKKPLFDGKAVEGLSAKMGFQLPADATIIAYRHKHNGDDSACCEAWVVHSSQQLAGPDRKIEQKRSPSPAKSLQALVEGLTGKPAEISTKGETICEYAEWRNGTTICRFRQMPTQTDWVAVLETISLH